MTYADGREIVPAPRIVPAPQMDYLGHPGTEQEKGRGTLQTSALPLGYGAERRKLPIYIAFLNPPRERLQTSTSQTSASQLGHAAPTETNSHATLEFLSSPPSVPATVDSEIEHATAALVETLDRVGSP